MLPQEIFVSHTYEDRPFVSPEFPTGNGQVDLMLRTQQAQSIIEIKSFSNVSQLHQAQQQAAHYAQQLGLSEVMLVVYAPLFPQRRVDEYCQTTTIETEQGIRIRVIVEVIGKM